MEIGRESEVGWGELEMIANKVAILLLLATLLQLGPKQAVARKSKAAAT